MSGSATLTTVMSSNSMKIATETAISVHHLRSTTAPLVVACVTAPHYMSARWPPRAPASAAGGDAPRGGLVACSCGATPFAGACAGTAPVSYTHLRAHET